MVLRLAYWFHRVTSVDYSVSLSVVSPSEEEMQFQSAYWIPVCERAADNHHKTERAFFHTAALRLTRLYNIGTVS
jgi:hypothetical protein